MSIDPNTILPDEVDQSYDSLQQIKDYIPTTNDTSAQVRDKVRKLASYLYKYLEHNNPEIPSPPPKSK